MLLTTFHRVTVRINLIARGNLEFDKNSRESFQRELKKEKKELHVTVSNKITRLLFIDPISLILVNTFPSESAKRMKKKKKKEKKMQRHVNAFFAKRIGGGVRTVKLKKTERRASRAKLHVLLVSYFCFV